MKTLSSSVIFFSLLVFTLSCSGPGHYPEQETEAEAKSIAEQSFENDLSRVPSEAGIAGLFNVPEHLCLSVSDSASVEKIAGKVNQSYDILEEALLKSGVNRNGPFGQIMYNNDTTNFKYEAIVLIEKIPATQPEHAKVVILEACQMLIYNYYGPYQFLYTAYAELGNYAASQNLEQDGQLREYYITDPRKEGDAAKLRTMLLLPVRKGG